MSNYKDEIRTMLARMDEQKDQESQENTQPPPADDIQDVYVLIVREHDVAEDQAQVVDSTPSAAQETKPPRAPAPISAQHDSFLSAYIFVCFSLFLVLATLVFQLYCMFNPPIATVTIIPKSQQVTLNGTLQLGRLLPPITISQSATTPTKGKGHQDARNATGNITFYNGQLTSVFVAAGTVFTGSDGVQIVTDQDATIPAANLPQVGQTTVSAHAMQTGSKGNISAYDINQGCCATAIKAVNTNSFYGGQDERTYNIVTHHDIHSISTVLKTTLAHSITGALQGQLNTNEQLQLLPCHPTVTSDKQPGEEAIQVKISISLTCSAIAYDTKLLETKATQLLTTQGLKKLGSGYSLFGNIHMKVNQASLSNTSPHLVFLSLKATGTWIYGLSRQAQEQIKELLAGKSKDQALHIIASMPGVERAVIHFDGFGDATRLPKNTGYIHIILLVS